MNEVIRLTNKTAIALRRNAKRVKTAHVVAACVLSAVLAGVALALGLWWLPSVPIVAAAAVLMDWAIMLHARSSYLSLIGQAICTEAAAQEIQAGRSEKTRRERAINDLMGVKADVKRAQSGLDKEMEKAPGAQPFFEEKAEASEWDDEDDDMLPAVRNIGRNMNAGAAQENKTHKPAQDPSMDRTMIHTPVRAAVPEQAATQMEETIVPRRRRRQSSQSGSLQLIKNEAK